GQLGTERRDRVLEVRVAGLTAVLLDLRAERVQLLAALLEAGLRAAQVALAELVLGLLQRGLERRPAALERGSDVLAVGRGVRSRRRGGWRRHGGAGRAGRSR